MIHWRRNGFSKILAVLITVFMLMGMTPRQTFAENGEDTQARVAVENTVQTTEVEAAQLESETDSAGVKSSAGQTDASKNAEISDEPADAIDKSAGEDNTAHQEDRAQKQKAALQSLLVHTGYTPSTDNVLLRNETDDYDTTNVFDADETEYTLASQIDSVTQLRFQAAAADATVMLHYGNGQTKDITWSSGSSQWANCLSPGKNTLKIVVIPKDTAAYQETTYTLNIDVFPTLTNLSVSSGGTSFYLDKTFAADTNEYIVTIPNTATSVDFAAVARKTDCKVTCNGSESMTVDVTKAEKAEIQVITGEGSAALCNTYTVTFNKADAPGATFKTSPKDAIVKVYDQKGATIEPNEKGVYSGMFAAQDYTYVVTKYGYVSAAGIIPAGGGQIDVTLKKAPDDGLTDVDADWENFRNSETNMGITDIETPISPDETVKIWNLSLGSGWNNNPSTQIIVDNALVVMCNKSLYKLDLKTGQILAQGTMVEAPNFGYTPPIYAEGMIICPLGSGTIQAFNAKTLKSLWIYRDNLKGQSLSPITYSGGYIYTGFWNGETQAANYVCISVTDEDPTKPDEAKLATWKHTQNGGFYWAGSVSIGDTVVVGTDDGTSGTKGNASLYSFRRETGEIIDRLELQGVGDQRSSMAYDKATGRIYFTTKGGYLCSVVFNQETGTFSNLKTFSTGAQSTSTPVVYKGRVYFATGSGISSTGSSGNIVVADAESLQMLYAVGLKGYPQCSLLLSTAYEAKTGYIYLYSTYNAKPGGISALKIKPDATTADEAQLIELYDAAGYEQYCISSLICGKDGTLYYKNDSGNVFAIGLPDVVIVRNLIDKLADAADITLADQYDIKDAREAYDALTEDGKRGVTNYSKLEEAEKALEELKAQQTETEGSAGTGEATGASDSTLGAVSEANRAAARAITKSAKITLKAEMTENAKKTVSRIEEFLSAADGLPDEAAEYTDEQMQSVIDAYKAYLELSDEEKLAVEERESWNAFTEILAKIADFYHYDETSGIDMRENEDSVLPWYVRMIVEPKELTQKQKEDVSEALGKDSKVLTMNGISFIDGLDGSEWHPDSIVKVKMQVEDTGDYDYTVVVHITDDDQIELIEGSVQDDTVSFRALGFSLYGIVGTDKDLFGTEKNSSGMIWIWIVVGVIALAAIGYQLYRRKGSRKAEKRI